MKMPFRAAPVATEPDFLAKRVDCYFGPRRAEWPVGQHILKGRAPGPGAVLMRSNDYLCISEHPAVLEAREQAARSCRHAQLMAAVFLDQDSVQARFEREMADFIGSEASLLCQSGWDANVGLVQAIAAPQTPVYIDIHAHASLWEGIRSARATAIGFRHNDVEHLAKHIGKRGPGIVIVDSVYSTNGDVAPLVDIATLVHDTGCALIVDESHSLGSHGPCGRGLVAALGIDHLVHFRTSSLAKTFAGRAGIVACSARHAEYLKYHARPAVFSSGLLAHEIEVLRATITAVAGADGARARLARNAEFLRSGLAPLGMGIDADGEQIVALVAGEEPRTMRLRDALEARGVFGSVFCDPATPRGGSLVRLTVTSGHSRAELEHVIETCAAVAPEMELDEWPANRKHQLLPRAA